MAAFGPTWFLFLFLIYKKVNKKIYIKKKKANEKQEAAKSKLFLDDSLQRPYALTVSLNIDKLISGTEHNVLK